jgi:hypothetical protein
MSVLRLARLESMPEGFDGDTVLRKTLILVGFAYPVNFLEPFHRVYLLDVVILLTPLSTIFFGLLHSLPDVLFWEPT